MDDHVLKVAKFKDMGRTANLVFHPDDEPMANGNMAVWVFLKDSTGVTKRIGGFQVDTKRDGLLNIHIALHDNHQKKGYGREIYDFVERYAQSLGRQFVPSEGLTEGAAKIWKQRSFSMTLMSEDFQKLWNKKWGAAETRDVGKGVSMDIHGLVRAEQGHFLMMLS